MVVTFFLFGSILSAFVLRTLSFSVSVSCSSRIALRRESRSENFAYKGDGRRECVCVCVSEWVGEWGEGGMVIWKELSRGAWLYGRNFRYDGMKDLNTYIITRFSPHLNFLK